MKQSKRITATLLATVMTVSCFFTGGAHVHAEELSPSDVVNINADVLHHFSGADLADYKQYSEILTGSEVSGAAEAKTRIDAAIAVLDPGGDGTADVDFYDDMQNFGEYYTKPLEPEDAGDPFPLSESQTTTASWQIIFSGLRAQTSVMSEYANSTLDANALSPKAYQLTSLQFKDYHMQHYQLLQTDGQTWNNGSLKNTDLWSGNNTYSLLNWMPHRDGGTNEQLVLGGKNWAGLKSGIIPSNRILKSLNFTVDMSKGKEFSVVYDWSDAQNYVYLTLTNDHRIQYNKVENGKLTTTGYFHNVWQGWNHSKTWITDYETNSSFTKSDLKFEIAWNDDLTCYVLKFPDLIVNSAGAGYHDAEAGDPLTLYLNAYIGEMAMQLPQLYLRANGTSESMLQNVSLTYKEVGFTPSDEQENIRHSIQEITVFKGADLTMYTEWLAKIEEAKDVLLYQAPYSRLEAAIAKLDPDKDGTADATLYDDRKFFGEYHTLAGEPEQAGMPFAVNEGIENTSAYHILWGGLQAQTSILPEYEGYMTLDKLVPKAYDLTNYLFPAYHMQHYQLLQTDGQRWNNNATGNTMLYGGNNNNSILPWTIHRDGGDEELKLVASENIMTLKEGYVPEGKVITRIEATLNGNMEGFVTDWNGAGNYVSLMVAHDGIRYEQATNGKMVTPVSQIMGSGWNSTYWSGKNHFVAYLQDYNSHPVFERDGLKIIIEWSDALQCYVLEVPSAKYSAQGASTGGANQLGRAEGESLAIPLQHYSNGTKATQLTNLYMMNNANIGDILVTYGDPYVPPLCTEHVFTDTTVDDAYLKSAATCTSAAVYYKNCATCDTSAEGLDETATFTNGNALGHIKGSANTSEWKNADGQHYKICGRVTAGGTCAEHVDVGTCADNTDTAYDADEKDATHHWQTCNVCGDMVGTKITHKFVDDADCSDCGQAQHTHAYTRDIVSDAAIQTAPTCTSYGVYYKTCTYCDKVSNSDDYIFTGDAKDANNHGTNTKTVTADASGVWHYDKCNGCGEKVTGSEVNCSSNTWLGLDGSEHYKKCDACEQEIADSRGTHGYGSAGYTHVGKCTCGKDDPSGAMKAVDFRPYILGGKILQGDVAAAQKLRIDIDFSDIDLADNSDVKIQYYGVAIAKKTAEVNVDTLKSNVAAAFTSNTLDGSAGVIAKDYTAGTALGYENDIMRVKINVNVDEFGKGVALVAFVKAEDGTYYWAENDYSGKSDSTVIEGLQDGFYITSVLRVMKNVLKDGTTNGYYGKLDQAATDFYTINPDSAINKETYTSAESIKTLVARMIGAEGFDPLTENGAIVDAKNFMRYVFYYCYTPQS